MQRFRVELVVAVLMVLMASAASVCAQEATVSGVVRDASGVAQLGVLVEATTAGSPLVRRAFTDLSGHYLFRNLTPGKYQVRASSALFLPALRSNLRLQAGARAIVNLTMSTILDSTSWLPAERRRPDEPADDWKWTLRSASNRPILRILEDGNVVLTSDGAEGTRPAQVQGRVTVKSGHGFGEGGVHSVVALNRMAQPGSGMTMRMDAGSRQSGTMAPSMEMDAGYEHAVGFGGSMRVVSSVQSHPEMVGAGNGLQSLRVATAQDLRLGDTIDLQAGSSLLAVHSNGYVYEARPFLRVVVEPSPGWTVGFRMASARDLQAFSDLDAVQQDVPVAARMGGKLRMEQGRHLELSAGHKAGRGMVQVTVYRDAMDRVAIGGGGAVPQSLNGSDLQAAQRPAGILVDSTTGEFRLLTTGYTSQGVNLTISQPLGAGVWTAVEYSTGSGLASDNAAQSTLASVADGLHVRSAQTASLAVKGTVAHTGTWVRAVYRWQPEGVVTPVDSYRGWGDEAYLSCQLRQPIRWRGVLPQGMEASVDVANLLAQGYRPFLSADGRTLYLAQSPRMLQAGLSINF